MLSASSSLLSSHPDSQNARRAYLLEHIRERYPRYQPLNDFEIFILGISNDIIPDGKLRTWLDEKFAQQLAWKGNAEGVFEDARVFLDLSGGILGVRSDQFLVLYVSQPQLDVGQAASRYAERLSACYTRKRLLPSFVPRQQCPAGVLCRFRVYRYWAGC